MARDETATEGLQVWYEIKDDGNLALKANEAKREDLRDLLADPDGRGGQADFAELVRDAGLASVNEDRLPGMVMATVDLVAEEEPEIDAHPDDLEEEDRALWPEGGFTDVQTGKEVWGGGHIVRGKVWSWPYAATRNPLEELAERGELEMTFFHDFGPGALFPPHGTQEHLDGNTYLYKNLEPGHEDEMEKPDVPRMA